MTIIKFNKLLFIMCLTIYIFSPMSLLSNDTECQFDLSGIDKAFFLRSTKFNDANWDNKRKEATIILGNNEKIVVRYMGCNEFGLAAEYTVNGVNMSAGSLKSKIRWLGSKLLKNDDDFKLLCKALDEKQFNQAIAKIPNIPLKEPIYLDIPGSHYIEFWVEISKLNNSKYKITISWYIG